MKEKVKNPVKPINRIKNLKYRVIVEMNDGDERDFTMTEMDALVDMWQDFKKQTGFKSI